MHAAADSGCNETAQLMCERFKLRLCWLQRKSWFCGDARVMDVLLGVMHCWRWSGEPYIPVCPSVGRKLTNCQRQISHKQASGPRRRDSGLAHTFRVA